MTTYIAGGLILIAVILAARSYFGKKYGGSDGCCGCAGCARAKDCGVKKQR